MFSSNGQRSKSRFLKKVVLLISLDLLVEIAKLGTVNTSREKITPVDVQVTWSKVKVKFLVFEKMFSAQYLKLLLLDSN